MGKNGRKIISQVVDCKEYNDSANAANFFNVLSHNNKSLSTQQLQQLDHKTAAQSKTFKLEIFMQNRNEMTTNVIKQNINVGFETPNRKTWNMSQLQKEA